MQEAIKNKAARGKPFTREELSQLLGMMEEAHEECFACFHLLKEIPFEVGQIRRKEEKKNCPPFQPVLSETRDNFIVKFQSQCLEMVETASKLVDQFDNFNAMLMERDLL